VPFFLFCSRFIKQPLAVSVPKEAGQRFAQQAKYILFHGRDIRGQSLLLREHFIGFIAVPIAQGCWRI
jgi:hypothetical protein